MVDLSTAPYTQTDIHTYIQTDTDTDTVIHT